MPAERFSGKITGTKRGSAGKLPRRKDGIGYEKNDKRFGYAWNVGGGFSDRLFAE